MKLWKFTGATYRLCQTSFGQMDIIERPYQEPDQQNATTLQPTALTITKATQEDGPATRAWQRVQTGEPQ